MDFLHPDQNCHDVIQLYRTSFSESPEAVVFSDSNTTYLPLHTYLNQVPPIRKHKYGDIVVIPKETADFGGKLRVDFESFKRLAMTWNIPPAAVRSLLLKDWGIAGYYEQRMEPMNFVWYSLPVGFEGDSSSHYGYIRFLSCEGATVGENAIRTILVVPKPLICAVEELLSIYTHDFTFDLQRYETWRFQLLLAELAFDSIASSWAIWAIKTDQLLSIIQQVLPSTSNTNWLSQCNDRIFEGESRLQYIDKLKKIVAKIAVKSSMVNASISNNNSYSFEQAISAVDGNIDDSKHSYSCYISKVQLARDNMQTTINTKTTQYLLANTIAYRRIAEQNEKGNKNIEALAEASRKDASDMKKVAYLTMFYLPGTFLASVFSMPFFDISDDGAFSKSLAKSWIYFSLTAALTVLTLAISWSWDRLQHLRSSVLKSPSTTVDCHEDLGDPTNPDISVLEPTRAAEPDLEFRVAQFFEKYYNNLKDEKHEG